MRKRIVFVLASVFLLQVSFAQSLDERKDRVMASYLAAFGVLPQDGELNYWVNDPLAYKTVNDLVNEHKKNIGNQQELQDRAIRNSYYDAFGRAPRSDEYKTWRPLKLTYSALMERHIKFLRDYPSSFDDVIKLSYVREFNRQPAAQELSNWKGWGVRSYLSIVQEHQKNKKAGMFATSGSSSKLLSSKNSGVVFQPSSKIAQETAKVSGAGVIATGGGNVIATGGGNVISTGGGN